MINLLPPSTKEDVALARKNVKLLKLNTVMVLIITGIFIISIAGLFYMDLSKRSYIQQNERSKSLIESQNLGELEKQIEDISGNIKLTTDVLSRQILFSKLIRQIGAAMPANTSLSGLNIDKDDAGVSLTAIASSYDTASQIQVNLSDPKNKIFDKADIININCNNVGIQKYPCDITLRARFGDNNSFKFIDPKAKP